ncbi:MAG TPA: flagellar basal-body MS-ring/collar protein FliF [Vicinamibacterales bacterium]
MLNRLRSLSANFTTSQLVSLGATFVLVVGIVAGSAFWLNKPDYALLFADMDQEAAGQVVARLKSLKVPYVLEDGGRSIRVQASRVDELRLELTAQGLPSSGRVGFEIFDRTAFGATEFLEQVNYRRALEGEIARTISTIGEVSGARVHIAMGKDSLFGEKRPAKASVVLKLRDQRGLSPATVVGISNLVAASVEGLRPESVVILDNAGRPLSRPEADNDPLGGVQLERQQKLEADMATRVIALLEPVVGEGRVRANVALTIDPRTREITEDTFDPNTVVRSRQTSADLANMGLVAGGIAGTRGNLPTAAPSPPGAQGNPQSTAPTPPAQATPVAAVSASSAPGSSRTTETTNYEVSRTTSRTIAPPGDVARMSVAVILDDNHVARPDAEGKPVMTRVSRTPEELQKLQALVAAAVGLDPERGDQITVENIPFDEPFATEPAAPTFWVRYGPSILDGARTVSVLLIGLAAIFFVVRPMMRRTGLAVPALAAAGDGAAVPALDRPRTVAELESEIEAQVEAAIAGKAPDNLKLPVLKRKAAALASKEPENTAKLIRGWMTEAER